MKYFLDSAKLDEIKYAYENYGIDGVTTNPKHIKMSGKPFMQVVKDVAAWIKEAGLEAWTNSRYLLKLILILKNGKILWKRLKKWQHILQIMSSRFRAASRV